MKRNILIVEDDTDINALLKTIIEGEGYEVTQAFSGTEARLCFKNSLPDLILLDLMLPGMTGEAVLQSFREEMHSNLPVIILSAKDTVHDKVTLLRLGADDYITKPFEPEEVLARIQAALRRSSQQIVQEPKTETVLIYGELRLDTELRKVMIKEHAQEEYIQSVYGVGFRLAKS